MSEETKTTQTEATQVNQPSTEAGKNNVEQSVPLTRFSEVNNKMKAQAEELSTFKAKEAERLEQEKIKAGEFQTVINDQKKQIAELTKVQTEWNTFQKETKTSLMEKLPEDKKLFGENMDLVTLQKFVDAEVQSAPVGAGKMPTDRQGVNPTGEFGGYNSHEEWAEKDPAGYQQARNPLSGGGIKIAYE